MRHRSHSNHHLSINGALLSSNQSLYTKTFSGTINANASGRLHICRDRLCTHFTHIYCEYSFHYMLREAQCIAKEGLSRNTGISCPHNLLPIQHMCWCIELKLSANEISLLGVNRMIFKMDIFVARSASLEWRCMNSWHIIQENISVELRIGFKNRFNY